MSVTITTGEKARADRVPSTISFPYSDITDAIAVAEGLLKGGGVPLSRDQLGAAMGLVPNTGSFNTKVSTARIFGVMDVAGGKYQLTDLGDAITDAGRQREAMVEAFIQVDLYKKVYDEFRGKRLPPRPHGLERAFIQFGVSPKQAKNARLAFDKSARLAGFFPNGDEDRLVMPFGAATAGPAEEESAEAKPILGTAIFATPPRGFASGGTVAGGTMVARGSIHPSIMGMVEELPPAKSDWSKVEQADWLQALATMFRVIYKGDDEGTISVTVVRNTALHPPPRRPINLEDDL